MLFGVIFFFAFVAFNAVGLVDLPIYRISALTPATMNIFVSASIALALGLLATSVMRFKPVEREWNFRFRFVRSLGLVLALLAAVVCGQSILSGASVSDFDGRFGTSTGVFLVLYVSILFHVFAVNAYLKYTGKVPPLLMLQIAGIVLLGVLSGYRSPVVIIVLSISVSYFAFRYRAKKNLAGRDMLAGLAVISVVLVGSGYYSQYRTTLQYGINQYYYQYYVGVIPDWLLFSLDPLATTHADQITVDRLSQYADSVGTQGGQLFASNFLTLLPGEQLAARNIVGSITTNRVTAQGRPWSITPTIQGALYTDWGYGGVIAGMFLLGAIVGIAGKRLVSSPSPATKSVASFVLVTSFMSIHNGYPDATFYLTIFVFLCIHSVLKYRPRQVRGAVT